MLVSINHYGITICWSVNATKHDDVIKWKYFPRNWPFVRGIHRSLVNSPHKGQWHGALMLSLICIWINDLVNNGEAGDLRRYPAHCDVTVMILQAVWIFAKLVWLIGHDMLKAHEAATRQRRLSNMNCCPVNSLSLHWENTLALKRSTLFPAQNLLQASGTTEPPEALMERDTNEWKFMENIIENYNWKRLTASGNICRRLTDLNTRDALDTNISKAGIEILSHEKHIQTFQMHSLEREF